MVEESHVVDIGEADETEQGCCCRFWGPFRPVFGGHSLEEAGSSAFIPNIALFIFRALVSIFLVVTLITLAARSQVPLLAFESWIQAGLIVSFILSAISTLKYGKIARQIAQERSALAFATVFVFQIFATASLFNGIMQVWLIAFLWKTTHLRFGIAFLWIVASAIVLIDLFLTLRMEFKLMYALMAVVLITGIKALSFVLAGGHLGFDPGQNEQFLPTWIIALLVFVLPLIVVSFVTFLLSRCSRGVWKAE